MAIASMDVEKDQYAQRRYVFGLNICPSIRRSSHSCENNIYWLVMFLVLPFWSGVRAKIGLILCDPTEPQSWMIFVKSKAWRDTVVLLYCGDATLPCMYSIQERILYVHRGYRDDRGLNRQPLQTILYTIEAACFWTSWAATTKPLPVRTKQLGI